jgi:hypothetical protein
VAGPLARADPLGEGRHPVERLVHLLNHVDAVDDQRALARHPQRHVQNRTVLGDVDVLAGEHRFAALGDAALTRQLTEQDHRLVRDPVLGEVEVEAGAVGDQPLAARRVGLEKVAQVALADLGMVALQRPPSRPGHQITHSKTTLRCSLSAYNREKEQRNGLGSCAGSELRLDRLQHLVP